MRFRIILVMRCPACNSDRLAVHAVAGFEALMVKLTKKRKYMCLICRHSFRRPDRRKTPRDGKEQRSGLRIPIQ